MGAVLRKDQRHFHEPMPGIQTSPAVRSSPKEAAVVIETETARQKQHVLTKAETCAMQSKPLHIFFAIPNIPYYNHDSECLGTWCRGVDTGYILGSGTDARECRDFIITTRNRHMDHLPTQPRPLTVAEHANISWSMLGKTTFEKMAANAENTNEGLALAHYNDLFASRPYNDKSWPVKSNLFSAAIK